MPQKKELRRDNLRKRFERRIDSYATPLYMLPVLEQIDRAVALMHYAYEAGERDRAAHIKAVTGKTSKGVPICRTCGHAFNSLGHDEVCGI